MNMFLRSEAGYDVPFEAENLSDANVVIVAMHGFCGDKESSCIQAIQDDIAKGEVGLIKFDWPGHGESKVGGDFLTIENCMKDISSVVKYVREQNGSAKVVAFATSFGGYLTLLFNHISPNAFDYIILRSPAINMHEILMRNILSADNAKRLVEVGFVNYGFERELKITSGFVSNLAANNIDTCYAGKKVQNMAIIHGTADDLVPFGDSRAFADKHGCALYPVDGADHRYKKPGEIDKVLDITRGIIKSIE